MDINEELIDPPVNKLTEGKGDLPNATAILVLGIISIAICLFYGLPGLICGIIALALYSKTKRLYESNPSYYEASFKNAKAGFVCAIIGVSLSFLMIVLLIASLMTDNFGQGFDL